MKLWDRLVARLRRPVSLDDIAAEEEARRAQDNVDTVRFSQGSKGGQYYQSQRGSKQ